MSDTITALVWLRRDFRLRDQTALFTACREHPSVLPVFVLDPRILKEFAPGKKPHAAFFGALLSMRAELRAKEKDLLLIEGDPKKRIPELARTLQVQAVHCSKDYEPETRARDEAVRKALAQEGIGFQSYKDTVLFEESELLNGSGAPYKVFTPYKNAAFARLASAPPTPLGLPRMASLLNEATVNRLAIQQDSASLWKKVERLVQEGLKEAGGLIPATGEDAALKRLDLFIRKALASYSEGRNLPAISGTSRLSMDLRSGAISPRQVWTRIQSEKLISPQERSVFLSELCWRDFFHMVGFHFPHVYSGNYNAKYSRIAWRNDRAEFQAWCEGRTGYPIVDAGMRELVQSGFMHNRVRMITAMFLTKDLLIDWRWGEEFFRGHLVDGDLAVNNGNWQWSASTGCDAQPYFRIFNPTTQGQKFDREGEYIRHWVPELAQVQGKAIHTPPMGDLFGGGTQYPPPIVDHSQARNRCLLAFKATDAGS